jgi:hypothetical protein
MLIANLICMMSAACGGGGGINRSEAKNSNSGEGVGVDDVAVEVVGVGSEQRSRDGEGEDAVLARADQVCEKAGELRRRLKNADMMVEERGTRVVELQKAVQKVCVCILCVCAGACNHVSNVRCEMLW